MAKVSQEDVEAALGNGIDSPEQTDDSKKDDKKVQEKKDDDTEDPDDEDEKVKDKKDESEDDSKKDDKSDDKKDVVDKKDEKSSDKKDDKDDKKSDDEPFIEDDLIAKALEDKFEISNYKDLVETLEGVDALMDEHEKLVEENKKLKETKPELKFESEGQKKVYEFLTKTGYDPERVGEGVMTHAKLISMDLSKDADPKMILEEKYVIEHPELTRAEAQKKFERYYNSKFVVDKTKFEDPEELKEEQELADIEKKSAVSKALDFLKKKQDEFKPAEKPGKKEAAQEEKISKEVEDGVKKTVGDFRTYMDGLDTLTFTDQKNPGNTFTYKVPKNIQKQVLEAGTKWLSRPELYSEKGEISDKHNTERYAHNVTMSLVWEDLIEKLLRTVEQKAKIVNVEQKSEKKPERKGGEEKGNLDDMDWMDAAEIDANNRLKKRKQMAGR